MASRAPNYKLVFAILALAAAVTYWARLKPVKVLFTADLQAFPTTIGSWTGRGDRVDKTLRGFLNADEVLSRTYLSSDGYRSMGVWVVYRKYGRRDFAHRPEMCYPASGWEIVGRGYTTVPYGGKQVRAVKVFAEKDGEKELIVYWFASGARTEANFAKQQLWMALDRLRTQKYGWAFIRLNCPVTDTEEAAMASVRGFMSSASAPLQKALTEPKTASAP
jgi:EpsI family protein